MTDNSQVGFLTLSDLEGAASKKASRTAWAYVQGGAGDERTMNANRGAFQRWTLRPRVLVDVKTLDLTTTLLQEKVSVPFYVSPTAYHGLLHPVAEAGTARAASAASVLAVFNTISTLSLENIAQAAPAGPRWFQLYLQPEFMMTRRLVERAEKSSYTAIVLTVDLPVSGNRDRSTLAGFRFDSSNPLGNGTDVVPPLGAPIEEDRYYSLRDEASATWEVLEDLQPITSLPILVKGVLTGEDARKAVDHGAKSVVVSNHGGRQLDGAPASLDALPEVVKTVGTEVEVYLDGGIRGGSDIVTALALGAKAVGVGRPILWGLAAGGEAGVAKVISLLKVELATVMALIGRRRISEIDRTLLSPSRNAAG